MNAPPILRTLRRHPAWTAAALALFLLVLLFDWNWLRRPLEYAIFLKTDRTFRVADFDVSLGRRPTVRLRDVYFANTSWGRDEPTARIGRVEFTISLRELFDGKILIPRLALSDADVLMERSKDGRRNWRLDEPDDREEGRLRIGTLTVDRGRLRYLNHGSGFELQIAASPLAQASEAGYSTRYAIGGAYQGATFSGEALSGNTLSFRDSGQLFPLKGYLAAGTTRLDVDGRIADVMRVSAADVRMKIRGQTMANLFPFLRLPLPASPPYQLEGRLRMDGARFDLEGLSGNIGATDVAGSAAYERREPRPLLTVDLKSRRLVLADVGPMIGGRLPAGNKPALTQSETRTRSEARQNRRDDGKLLPAGTFQPERLRSIDADVRVDAGRLEASSKLPYESLHATLRLREGVLTLAPLTVGFGGGSIQGRATFDARQSPIKAEARIDMRRVRLDRLMADAGQWTQNAGSLGVRAELRGTGNSIAAMAANADGTVAAAISGGRVSNLVDAATGLNGGKVLSLLVGGDKNIAIRCGGARFDVKSGKGTSRFFVIDTEQTQVLGRGGFDLGQETFELDVEPRPKEPGILSLRTPVRLYGTFSHPEYELHRGPLAARAAGALALSILSPLAALLPLIETGPGTQTDCGKVLAAVPGAQSEAAPADK